MSHLSGSTAFPECAGLYPRQHCNEYEVAEHFHIPLRQIKEWIREGRIEYHEVNTASTISGMHCQRCGAPVSLDRKSVV